MKNNDSSAALTVANFRMFDTCRALLLPMLLFVTFSSRAQLSNVPVTGFNQDLVANGVGAPNTSTTTDLDGVGAGFVFVDGTYKFSAGCAFGPFVSGILPASNQVTSGIAPTLIYNLQSYTGSNALRVPATGTGTGTGTLTVTTPVSAANLYLLCVSGGGALASGITVTVTFTDATTQIFTNQSTQDWCNTTSSGNYTKITAIQYLRAGLPGTCVALSTCQYFAEMTLAISSSNYGKSIASININKTLTTTAFSIFAVGIMAPCAVPNAPPSFSTPLSASGSISQVTGAINPAVPAPTGGYLVVRYPAGSTVTAPVSGTNYTAGNFLGLGTVVQSGSGTSITATGLNPGTPYDFYVYSFNLAATCGGPVYSIALSQAGVTTAPCGGPVAPVTVSIGPGLPNTLAGGFTSITNALGSSFPTSLASTGILAPVILELQNTYTSEVTTTSIVINNNGCFTSTNNVTIRPAAGANGLVIASSVAGPTIDMDGARFITIDGTPGGTTGTPAMPVTAAGANNAINLNIKNSSLTGEAIRFKNEARVNTVLYCDLQGANNAAPLAATGTAVLADRGIVFIGTTNGTTGNDSIIIDHCNIHPAVANAVMTMGVYSYSTQASVPVATFNDACRVTNNNIYDIYGGTNLGSTGIGLAGGTDSWIITGNSFFQTASRTPVQTASVVNRAIFVAPTNPGTGQGNNFTVNSNYIGGTGPQCSGTAMTSNTTGSFNNQLTAIEISVAGGTATNVKTNTVTNINISQAASTGDIMRAIAVTNNGNVNVGGALPADGNVIGSSLAASAVVLSSTSQAPSHMILVSGGATSATNILVQNNKIGGVRTAGTGTSMSGIFCNSSATISIDNNLVGSTSVANSFEASGNTTTAQFLNGIRIPSGSSTASITNNTICNLNNNSTSTTSVTGNSTSISPQTGGIIITGSTTTVIVQSISGNTIRNLTNTAPSPSNLQSAALVGIGTNSASSSSMIISNNTIHSLVSTSVSTSAAILMEGIVYVGSASNNNTITRNFVHSLDVTATNPSASMRGIELASGAVSASNNMIRMGIKPDGSSNTTPMVIYGILNSAANQNIYHNSVYMGGNGVTAGAGNTFAFWRNSTTTADVRDNIFVNARSGAGAGKNYSLFCTSAAAFAASLTLNYNNYQATGTNGVFAFNGTADVAAYVPNWFTGDVASVYGDAQFINPVGTATGVFPAVVDLHINAAAATPIEGAGFAISSVLIDYDSQTRGTFTPTDIGADAGNFTGTLPVCDGGTLNAGTAQASNVTTCTAALSLTGVSAVYGLSYQWQSRTPSGAGAFTNIPGANFPTLTVNLPGATADYQCIITCSAGGTATSALVAVTAATPGFAAGYSVLEVTGFNHDVIANGNTGSLNIPSATCTAPVDGTGSNYYFYDASYSYLGNVFPATSLPINGQVVSANVQGLLYRLQSATGNNVLQLRGGGAPGTTLTGAFALNTPQNGTAVYLLGNSGNGASTVNVTVTFTDATTQAFTGISIPDWFNVTPYSQGGFGRVRDASPGFDAGAPTGQNPRMYDVTLALLPSNYSKNVQSISITNTTVGASATQFITNIFAVTMAVAAPTPFCGGLATSVTLFNPPAGATFQWQSSTTQGGPYTNVVGGSGATTTTYTNPGATGTIYYVCNVTCPGGFSALSTEVVETINPIPVINVAPTSSTFCSGGAGIPINASGSTAAYSWLPVAGLNTAVGASVIATPSSTTVYTVTGVANGCLGTATSTVNFISTPVAGASATATNVCSGGTTTLNATPASGVTYSWSPATFLNSTTSGSVIASGVTATTTYTVTVANGICTSTASVTINVSPLAITPAANIILGSGCAGTTVYQLAAGVSGGGQPYSYSWAPATGLNSSTIASPTSSPAVTTTYTVTVTDNCGTTVTGTALVTVVSSPSISVSATPSCSTGDTLFANGIPPSGVTWYWQPSMNGTSTTLDASTPLVVTTNGTYYVRALYIAPGCWATADSIVINNFVLPSSPPAPVAAASPTCNPTSISVTSAPPGVNYYWQTTAGGTSTAQNASSPLPVSVTGTYYVRALESSGGCWSAGAGSVLVSVYQPLSGTVSATQISGCLNPTGLITANVSGAGTVINNDFSNPVLPSNMTSAGNSFAITGGQMQLTTNTGSQNGGVLITNPTGLANNDFQIDFDFITTYNAAGNSDGLSYSYGDDVVALPTGAAGTGTTGVSTLAAECGSGTKLKLTFDAVNNTGGCTAGTPGVPSTINNGNTIGVYLMYNSTTQFQGPQCPGVIYYDGGPSTSTYTNYVAGGPGTAAGISWKPTSPAGANTHVTIKINGSGQVSLWLNNIQVVFNQQLPASYLSADKSTWKHAFAARTGANGEGHYIDNLIIQYNNFYEYSTNGGASWSSTNPIIASGPGPYSVEARYVAVPSCSANLGSVTINPPAYTTTSTSTSYCTYGTPPTLGFIPAYADATYQWESSPAGANTWTPIATANLSTYTPPAGSLLVNTDFRCLISCSSVPITGSPTSVMTINVEAPVVNTPTPGTRCGPGSVTLSATVSPGATAKWYSALTGGSAIGSGSIFNTPVITVNTTYYVSAANLSGCESGRTAVLASLTASPAITVSPAATICQADSIIISASSVNDPNYQYTWNPGGFSGPSVKVAPGTTTTYTVTALDTTGGANSNCQDIRTVAVTVNQRPTITATSATPSIICGTSDSTQLSVTAIPFIPPSLSYNVTPGTYAPPACPLNAGPTGDDAVTVALNIGFNFNYFGTTYTQFAISTNGNIQLGDGSGSPGNPNYNAAFTATTLPSTGTPNNMIALCWADLTSSAGNITYGTTGVSPNQKLIICYNNIPWLNGSGNLTGQIILSEGSTNIELVLTSVTSATGNRVCGVENSAGTLGTMAPGHALGTWTASNESWIFSPPVVSSLTYSWIPVSGLTSTTITNPKALVTASTTYTVTVSETGTGCSATATTGVIVSAVPTPYIFPNDTVLCTGEVITIVARDSGAYGGAWPAGTLFDFGFGPTADSTLFVNGPSIYNVVVTLPGNMGSCQALSQAANIVYRDAPVVLNSQENIKCHGESTGYISAQLFLASPPYRFKYYNSLGNIVRDTITYLSEDTLFNIPAGQYYVIAYDTANTVYPPPSCHSDSIPVEITEPALLVASESHSIIACNGGSSTVNISAIGGTPPYSGTGTFTQAAGTQNYVVTDAFGCTSEVNLTITEPAVLAVSTTQSYAACTYLTGSVNAVVSGGTTPYTYSWTGGSPFASITGKPAGTYTVTVTDAHGCSATASATLAPPGPLAVSSTPTNPVCRGAATGSISINVTGGVAAYSYLWNGGTTTQNRVGLAAGTYTVTVTDINGCTKTKTTVVTQPATNLLINTTQTNIRCYGGNSGVASLSPSGGTAPYSYSWNTIPVQTTSSIIGLVAGVYTCTVTDAIGCAKNVVITITQPTDVIVFQTQTNVTFPGGNNGTATVSVSGGTPAYTYSWNTIPVKTTASVTGLTAGTYKCTVSDSKSCTKKVTFIITEPIAKVSLPVNTKVDWDIKAYPNPTSGMITLSFDQEFEESFRISFADFTGRLVYQNENKASAGPNQFVYDFTYFAKGVYFIRIQSMDKSKVIRIVIQ